MSRRLDQQNMKGEAREFIELSDGNRGHGGLSGWLVGIKELWSGRWLTGRRTRLDWTGGAMRSDGCNKGAYALGRLLGWATGESREGYFQRYSIDLMPEFAEETQEQCRYWGREKERSGSKKEAHRRPFG